MSWYEKLLNTARDVAPTVAGGAAMAASGGNPALGAFVISIVGKGGSLSNKATQVVDDGLRVAPTR